MRAVSTCQRSGNNSNTWCEMEMIALWQHVLKEGPPILQPGFGNVLFFFSSHLFSGSCEDSQRRRSMWRFWKMADFGESTPRGPRWLRRHPSQAQLTPSNAWEERRLSPGLQREKSEYKGNKSVCLSAYLLQIWRVYRWDPRTWSCLVEKY